MDRPYRQMVNRQISRNTMDYARYLNEERMTFEEHNIPAEFHSTIYKQACKTLANGASFIYILRAVKSICFNWKK